MADKAIVSHSILNAIGQAIIDKGGASAPMKPSEMAGAIEAIPSGGAVQSVNGIGPDEQGDVEVTASDVQLGDGTVESKWSELDGRMDAVASMVAVYKVTSSSELAHNRIAVVNGATGGTVSVTIAPHTNGLRRCQLLITDVTEDKGVSLDLPAATYKAVGIVTTTKGDNIYTFQEYDTNMWIVTKEGASAGGGGGTSDVFFLNADGDLVTSDDKLNDDGTVTAEGTLNDDGTLTITT